MGNKQLANILIKLACCLLPIAYWFPLIVEVFPPQQSE